MPVYLIRAGDSGPVKIGKADSPATRMSDFQIGHYEQLSLLRVWQGGYAEEASLHLRFADLRIRGEWFAFSRAMLGDVGLVEIPIPAADVTRELRAVLPLDATLPELIRIFTTDTGMSMRDLSLRAGLNETAVKAIMSGKSESPRGKTLVAIAGVTGIPLELLFAASARAAKQASAA